MIKPENEKFYGEEWKRISKEVKRQRNNECEICVKMGIKRNIDLTVHHKDRNPENNAFENLLVCCPRHHFQQEQLINEGYFDEGQLTFSLF